MYWCFMFLFTAIIVAADDTITLGYDLSGNRTITSKNCKFELGFFKLNDADKWYVGIGYAGIPLKAHVWVANWKTGVVTFAALKFKEDNRLAGCGVCRQCLYVSLFYLING